MNTFQAMQDMVNEAAHESLIALGKDVPGESRYFHEHLIHRSRVAGLRFAAMMYSDMEVHDYASDVYEMLCDAAEARLESYKGEAA